MGRVSTNGHDRTPSERVDVCVIGAGPAGGVVASQLASKGHDVVILEAGKWFDDDTKLARMEREIRPITQFPEVWEMDGPRDDFVSSGSTFYPLNHKRCKGVGGSTIHWGGRVSRFYEKDFNMQSRYGRASDWPIDYEDLKPYYARAEAELGVAGADDNPFAPPREEQYPMEAFPPSYSDKLFIEACEAVGITAHSVPNARNSEAYDGRAACVGYGTCSPVCPSGAQYSAEVHVDRAVQADARVIDRAVVQRLVTDERGETVVEARYRTPDGQMYGQRARQFVLAAGAVDTPRLLLLSASDDHPDGLANSSGAVGRYFMEHPFVGIDGEIDCPTKQHQIGFGTTESTQFYEQSEEPRGSFKIEFNTLAGPTPAELALQQRSPLNDTRRLLFSRDARQVSEYGRNTRPIRWGDELLEEIDAAYGNRFRISCQLEVLPYEQNRVTLDDTETDPDGNPVPNVSWGHFEAYEEHNVARAFEVMESIVDNLGPEVKWTQRFTSWPGAGHAAGTTRMGNDPEESVVNPDLRTHDVDNLFLPGSGAFVTNGATQPTLTIVALALRLAEHLDGNVL